MDVPKRIQETLAEIEREHQVRIFYACESGSRAWGFASSDSDYDVRFLYLHSRDWYLSVRLEKKRDVIELPIDDSLDVNGWDLRKALQLFQKSNPPLLEWLGSPIVYRESHGVAGDMRALGARAYSPVACHYHYWKMAKGNFRDYLQGETVSLKKYLYVLRPVLAVRWIERGLGVVPTEFQRLVDAVADAPGLKDEIAALLARKAAGEELARGPRIHVLSEFLESELDRLQRTSFEKNEEPCPTPELDLLFQNALKKVWA